MGHRVDCLRLQNLFEQRCIDPGLYLNLVKIKSESKANREQVGCISHIVYHTFRAVPIPFPIPVPILVL